MFDDLAKALSACAKEPSCGGVVHTKAAFELRAQSTVAPSPDEETAFVRLCPPSVPPPPHESIDRSQGGWTVGNAEHLAARVFVHARGDLPLFYDPARDGFSSLDEIGSFVGGRPTIFLKVASYRDELCHITIKDAFEKATHPG